jgi:hypothetical protein
MKDKVFYTMVCLWLTIIVFKMLTDKRETKEKECDEPVNIMDTVYIIKTDTVYVHIGKLTRAIMYVESKYNDSAVNLRTDAVGCLQIRPIMVREVNRIQRIRDNPWLFTNDDRYSRAKSIQMFNIWKSFHHRNDSDEVIARCWNGGGDGHTKNSTVKYWNKVVEKL